MKVGDEGRYYKLVRSDSRYADPEIAHIYGWDFVSFAHELVILRRASWPRRLWRWWKRINIRQDLLTRPPF